MRQFNIILGMAHRDVIRFLRDPAQVVATLVLPVIFIGILGISLQANLGAETGYNFLAFTFTGVLTLTLFQTTAVGVVALVEDRENDFSQEIFVAPISRYAIIFGRITGQSCVALLQGMVVVLFGVLLRVPLTLAQSLALLLVSLVVCLFGGAFGVLVLGNLRSQRAANQIFPFIIFPQFFLGGVLSPMQNLPPYLNVLSHLAPLRYAVDLVRGIFYNGQPDYSHIVLQGPLANLAIIGTLFVIFLVIGTWLYMRGEQNR